MPDELIDALIDHGARGLTIINNNAGNCDTGLAALIANKRVAKVVCSFPRQSDSWHFDAAYKAGEIELELVPQGNLAARIHAAGSRSEEHTSELQSLMRNSYAVFCLKKKNSTTTTPTLHRHHHLNYLTYRHT